MQRSAQYYNNDTWKPAAYKKAIDLHKQIIKSTQKVPINIKRGILSKIEDALIEIAANIVFADENFDDLQRRAEFIDKSLDILHEIIIRVRILKDLNYIGASGLSAISLLEENLSAQLSGWKVSTQKQIFKNLKNSSASSASSGAEDSKATN